MTITFTVIFFRLWLIVDYLPDNFTIAIKIHLCTNVSCSITVCIYLENNGCVIACAFKRFPFVKRPHHKPVYPFTRRYRSPGDLKKKKNLKFGNINYAMDGTCTANLERTNMPMVKCVISVENNIPGFYPFVLSRVLLSGLCGVGVPGGFFIFTER